MVLEVFPEIFRHGVQSARSVRGKGKNMPGPGGSGRLRRGGLLHDGMGICSADAEGTDAGHPPAILGLPRLKFLLHEERTVRKIDRRVGRLEVQAWIKNPILQRER